MSLYFPLMIDDYTGKHPNRIIMEIGCHSTMNFAYLFTAFFRSGLTSFVKGANPTTSFFTLYILNKCFKMKLEKKDDFYNLGRVLSSARHKCLLEILDQK